MGVGFVGAWGNGSKRDDAFKTAYNGRLRSVWRLPRRSGTQVHLPT